MRFVFRCDASVILGSGHVMRCLTLADQLRKRGGEILFLCRALEGNLCALIEARGFEVGRLSEKIDWEEDAEQTARACEGTRGGWLIVDHYGLDYRFELKVKPLFDGILVIDDVADRRHECDLLLDQNLYPEAERRYLGLVPQSCRTFLGPHYALLRSEFLEARRTLRERSGVVSRILVSFGGSDATNETAKAIEAVRTVNPELAVDVVAGASNPHFDHLRKLCSELRHCTLHRQVDHMAQLMASADLAIGSGGSTTWERCSLGLPSLTAIVAENQRGGTEAVDAAGATINLGWYEDVTVESIAGGLDSLLNEPQRLLEMSCKATEIMGELSSEHPLISVMMGEDHGR